jgi:hypothetical protein
MQTESDPALVPSAASARRPGLRLLTVVARPRTYSLWVMFCPDCGAGLDDVPVGSSCPSCGGSRRSTTAHPPTPVASGGVGSPRVVAASNYADGAERLETGSVDWRSTANSAEGDERQTFAGRPPRHEDDVLEVCALLHTAFVGLGLSLGPFFVNGGRVDDVDATADTADGDTIQVQVVRAAQEEVWRLLGREGQASSMRTDVELALAVVEAVKQKQGKYAMEQRARLVLAVDAIRAPGFALGGVVQRLRVDHRVELAEAGFRAIWLIGPSHEQVHLLVSADHDRPL